MKSIGTEFVQPDALPDVSHMHWKMSMTCSKRHSIQAVELSRPLQTAVQIVSKPPAPCNGARFTFLGGKPPMRTRWIPGAAPHKSG